MKTYLKITFWTAMLSIFIGAYILGSGKPMLVSNNLKLVTDLKESYLPFFKIGLSALIFCGLLKLYIDFWQPKNSPTSSK